MKFSAKRALPLRALLCPLLLWTLMLILMGNSTAAFAAGAMDKFMDPTDGQLDVSNWLLEKRGFLLNPFVITEPAIGYDGGATLLFFHEGAKEKGKRQEGEVLGLHPSISFLVGGGTETDSWLAGGGHFGSYLEDRIRYLGVVGYGEFNIDFYGLGWSGGEIDALDDREFVPSGGGGFRYLIARLLRLQTGMDFAGSEGDFAFNFQIGTGW